MDNAFTQSVLKTLAYFDLFCIPLTALELYHSLWEYHAPMSYDECRLRLAERAKEGYIEHSDGYYTLPHRTAIVFPHKRNAWVIEEKMRIARRAARILRFIPFFRALFVCNTLAIGSARKQSDIDVFVVVQHGRLWFARALITFALTVFGLRRTGKRITNKICLSFYVTDRHLDLFDIAIGKPDIYLAYWIYQLTPVYDPYNFLKKIHERNSWVQTHLQHAQTIVPLRSQTVAPAWWNKGIERMFEQLCSGNYGEWMEEKMKRIQQKKMEKNYHSLQHLPDTRVVISDDMLKFHENDRRVYYRDEWEKRCRAVMGE